MFEFNTCFRNLGFWNLIKIIRNIGGSILTTQCPWDPSILFFFLLNPMYRNTLRRKDILYNIYTGILMNWTDCYSITVIKVLSNDLRKGIPLS